MTWHASAVLSLTAAVMLPLVPGVSPSPGVPPPSHRAVFGPTAQVSPPTGSVTTAAAPSSTGPASFNLQLEWPLAALHANRLWRHGRGGGVTVAVIDTGIDVRHPDLAGAVSLPAVRDLTIRPRDYGADQSADSHGTAVAGIIAARGSTASQAHMVGLAPQATLLDIRVAVQSDRATSAAIAQGIVTAARAGADIINVSLTAPTADPALANAVSFAQARGCLIVAAAGSTTVGQALIGYPGVLTVAAKSRAGQPLSASPAVVWAPGAGLYSTGETHPVVAALPGYVENASGNGYAAAYVSAAAALLLSADRKLTPAAAGRLLIRTARRTVARPEPSIDPVAALDSALPGPRPVQFGQGGFPLLAAGLPIAGCLLLVVALLRISAVRRRRSTRLALAEIPPSSWDQSW
jgi:subtilisin family serine protease